MSMEMSSGGIRSECYGVMIIQYVRGGVNAVNAGIYKIMLEPISGMATDLCRGLNAATHG